VPLHASLSLFSSGPKLFLSGGKEGKVSPGKAVVQQNESLSCLSPLALFYKKRLFFDNIGVTA